jgi:antitoxin VapB
MENEDEVVIKKLGDMVILLPTKYNAETLLTLFKEIGPMEIEREQPSILKYPLLIKMLQNLMAYSGII